MMGGVLKKKAAILEAKAAQEGVSLNEIVYKKLSQTVSPLHANL